MKRILRAAKAILFLLFFLILIAPVVHAAEYTRVKIPFHIQLSGSLPRPDDNYSFVLEAKTDSAPMPTGSIGTQYIATVSGFGDFFFPAISYSRVGIYSYQVYQKSGTNPLCSYDSTIYNVTILITSRDSANVFDSTIIVSQADAPQEKCTITFANAYPTPVAPINIAVIKKWVDSGSHRPDNITVQLLRDNNIYDSVTLSNSNHWCYAWTGLPGNYQWNVVESNVPTGYTVAYELENGVYTITNTATLIQTGQLYWPIYLLGGGGLFFLLCGLILFVKQKHHHA